MRTQGDNMKRVTEGESGRKDSESASSIKTARDRKGVIELWHGKAT